MMQTLLQDLRFGSRIFLRNPGFTIVAVLCLGLGIGANTAVFSVVNAVLLKPLPFDEPEEIALIWTVSAGATTGSTEYFSRTTNFLEFRNAREFDAIEALVDTDFDLSEDTGEPERLRGGRATVGLFGLLGVPVNVASAVSLLVVLGLGVDYGIFSVDGAARDQSQGVTLSSLLVSCVTSVFVFGILALSEQPVLRAIGLTTGTGVLIALSLSPTALALATPRAPR